MEINFYKLHVLKNDFILSDFRNNNMRDDSLLSQAAVKICDRHTGVGGSGIIYLLSSENDTIGIKSYASDGSLYESILDPCMIASRYIFDTISESSKIIKIVHNAIPVTVQILDSMNFRIAAGSPLFNDAITDNLIIDNFTYNYTDIKLVKNGILFFPENKSAEELKDLYRKLIKSPSFSGKIPVFVFPTSRNSVTVKTWIQSKHTDNTLVCCMAAVASALNGYENDILVMFHKNAAYVEWDRTNNEVYVSAKPEYIFTGSFYFEDEKNNNVE